MRAYRFARERLRSGLAPAEAGLSLIEILVTIVILGVGVVGIVSMLANSLSATSSIRQRADVLQVVTRVNDAIQRATWECNVASPLTSYASTLSSASVRPSAEWTIEMLSMDHWGPIQRTFGGPSGTGCPAATDDAVFKTLRMTIRVTAPGRRGVQSTTVVKRV
jgi:prepilin-type N-terminal cleavage/methylation domain-containing protein